MSGDQCTSCVSKGNEECAERQKPLFPPAQNEVSKIKHVLAVFSGKGGVGKSLVSALIAVGLARRGFRTGILDADITGPSIPKMFGLRARPEGFDHFIMPVKTFLGIKVISLNLLLPEEDDPVIWRGPLISGAVKQFWTDVVWGEIDYLVVDLPPGTGDVPLTVMQSLPLNGLVVVTSPQDLVSLVVRKAIKMAGQMNVPVLGLVENMSYLECPHCGRKVYLFGRSHVQEITRSTGIELIDCLPVDPRLAELSDRGRIEEYQTGAFQGLFEKLGEKLGERW
ncbi:MAG: Mrp/NBP35 family ATP-binding protein [Bacillota bacterium]